VDKLFVTNEAHFLLATFTKEHFRTWANKTPATTASEAIT
jgi:hypothetical protein